MFKKLYHIITSSVSAQLLLLSANLLMPFFYTTADIGMYGFFITVASVFSMVASFRLEYFSFFASKKEGLCRESALNCALIHLLVIIGLLSILYLADYLSLKNTLCSALSLFRFSFFYLMTQITLLDKQYHQYGQARLLQSVILLIFLLLFRNYDYAGLVIAASCSQLSIAMFLLKRLDCKINLTLQTIPFLFTYRFYDRVVNTATTLLQYLSPALPMMLGIYYFSKDELGVYFLLSQLIGGAGSVLRRSIMAVLSAELMDDGVVAPASIQAIHYLFGGGILFAVLFALISTFFPTQGLVWQQWPLIQALLPPLLFLYILDAFIQPIGTLLPAIGHNLSFFSIECLRLTAIIISFMLVNFYEFTLVNFVYIYTVVMSLCYILAGILFIQFSRRITYEN